MKKLAIKVMSTALILSLAFSTFFSGNLFNVQAATDGPSFNGIQGKTLYICTEENNLITDGGFENGNGNWNTDGFVSEFLSVTDDTEAVNGSKSLKLSPTGKQETVKSIFYVAVEPETDYYFTSWVKGVTYSDINRADMTFGVVNAETGMFLASSTGTDTDRRYTSKLQLCPLSWDGEWHLTGIAFNSGNAEKIGIAVWSTSSQAYFDDMYLMKAENAVKYTSPVSVKAAEVDAVSPTVLTCLEENNLIENYGFSDTESDFWQTGSGFGGNFVITDASYTTGNTLRYFEAEAPEHKYYIKYIDVKPNTYYTFSAEYCVLKNGGGSFGITDGSSYLPSDITRFEFSDTELYSWQRKGISFNSGGHTRIGFFVYDGGGEALIDNIYLFEKLGANAAILNGGFEADRENWQWNEFGVTEERVHSGEKALILNDGSKGYQQTFQVINLSENTDYCFEFYYYAPSGSDSWGGWLINGAEVISDKTNPGVAFTRVGDATLVSGEYKKCHLGNWKKVEVEFNSGNCKMACVCFLSNEKEIYIDDVLIYEKDVTVSEEYSRECALPIAEAEAPSSPRAVSYTESSVTLASESGCLYKAANGNWKKTTERFNSGDNSCIILEFTNHEAKPIYLDDISLVSTSDNREVLYSGFEDDNFKVGDLKVGGWYWPGGVSETYYRSGGKSLQVGTGNNTRTFRCVEVSPNTEYEFTFYSYVPEGGSWWGEGWHIDAAPSNVDKAYPKDYFYNADAATVLKSGAYVKSEEWVSEPQFQNLTVGREYTFYAKTAETEAFSESLPSEPFVFTVPAEHGDADFNGEVNALDLATLKKVLTGMDVSYNPDGCDSNGDTVINILDLVSLKKRTVGEYEYVELSDMVSEAERKVYANDGIVHPVPYEYERLGYSNEYEYLIARDGFIY